MQKVKGVLQMAQKKAIDVLWDDKPENVTEEANKIWSVAKTLRGHFQSDQYRDVIIPFTIIRRLECALEETRGKVNAYLAKNPTAPEKIIRDKAGLMFYNRSQWTLASLLKDPANLKDNFIGVDDENYEGSYYAGFSKNVRDILDNLKFKGVVKSLVEAERLFGVIKDFSELDLDPHRIHSVRMGYIFEDLIRRFSENKAAGEHYTGRDVTKLGTCLLLSEGADDIMKERIVVKVGDQACGTGGMLSTAFNYITHLNQSAEVYLYGQEVNPESYAICLAEMLIKGQDISNIHKRDTFVANAFGKEKMRFVIENPPFGQEWGGENLKKTEKAVKDEHEKGKDGRWGAGLPAKGDGQLLFVQSAVDILDPNCGRAAIIEDGSPLFAGSNANSGESKIRKWLLDKDYLEAIIALPEDLFYNTNISTYFWIISRKKSARRRGKVQLIDARKICKPLKKSLGKKRNEITPECRAQIAKLYADFEENELCKIFDNEDFMYREYTVIPPKRRNYAITDERIDQMLSAGSLDALFSPARKEALEMKGLPVLNAREKAEYVELTANEPIYNELLDILRSNADGKIFLHPNPFIAELHRLLDGRVALTRDRATEKLYESMADGMSVPDRKADFQYDKKGKLIYDEKLKDTEVVPYKENIEDYMAREVLPHIPKAKWRFEEDLTKKKPVVKTGVEYAFTRYFYKYEPPRAADDVLKDVLAFDKSVEAGFAALKKEILM